MSDKYCDKIFFDNIRYIYKLIPGDYGYDAFVYNYKKKWDKCFDDGNVIGKNTFIDIFRKEYDPSLKVTKTMGVKAIRMINHFLSDGTCFLGTNDEVYNNFVKERFDETNCPAVSVGERHNPYIKYMQDYFVYIKRKNRDDYHTGILSIYNTRDGLQAYLLTYIVDEKLLRDRKTWSLFDDMNSIEDRYGEAFEKPGGNSPMCRLFKAKNIKLSKEYIDIEFVGVHGYKAAITLHLNILKTYNDEAKVQSAYQGGLALAVRSNPEDGFFVSNAILLACTNTKKDALRNPSDGIRKLVRTDSVYEPPLPVEIINANWKKLSNPEVFSYSTSDDQQFFQFFKLYNNNEYRRFDSATKKNITLSNEQIDEMIKLLEQMKQK